MKNKDRGDYTLRTADTTTRINYYLERYEKAYGVSQAYRGLFDDAYQYSQPNRNPFDRASLGSQRNTDIYDTTLVNATRQFVAQIHMALTPIYVKWTGLQAGENVPDDLKAGINRSLELATDVLFEYIWKSNFDLAINEAYYDLSIGTGALICNENEDDDDPLNFVSVAMDDISPEEGPNGTIETVWRRFDQLPIRNVLRLWPRATLNTVLKDKLKNDPNGTVSFVEGTIYLPKEELYEYIVIDRDSKSIVFEERTPSSPWIVFRWSKFPAEVLGYGPVLEALPTAKTLNKVYEDELRAAALMANPIFLGFSDGVFNPYTVRLKPNTIIPVSPMNGSMPIQPLQTSGNVQFMQLQVADLREQINTIMFGNPIGAMTDPTKTATEIMLRNQLALEAKAPSFGRLQVELINKLLNRVIYILKKRNLFPNIDINSREVNLNYKSPILESQGMTNAQNLIQYAQSLQQIAGPQVALGAFNLTKVPEYLAEALQVDLELVKTEEELEQMLSQAASAVQEQTQEPTLPTAPTGGLPGGELGMGGE
jgi:hypothetical protein